MRRLAALAILALAALPATTPAAAVPQTTLADVEDEVMCPICGTLLELSESPQAQRERVFVEGLIAEGKTKAEVKNALVAEYGDQVLALPEGSGFELSAYLFPAIGFLLAALAVAIGIARWRRNAGRAGSSPPATAGPKGDDAERLSADLARYDL